MRLIDTGCATVDRMGELDISGNVIPKIWFRMITKKSEKDEEGKAYLLAICILSDLVYWYRPVEVRDERTGQITGYYKKFSQDLLQKSYEELAVEFGESKRSIKSAMDRLEELKLIRRQFRNLKLKNGGVATNVMYVDLNTDQIMKITFEKKEEGSAGKRRGSQKMKAHAFTFMENDTSGQFVQKFDDEDAPASGIPEEDLLGFDQKEPVSPVNSHVTKNCRMIPQKNAGYPTEKCNMILQKNAGYPTENCDMILQKNAGYPTEKCNMIPQKNVGYPTENNNMILQKNAGYPTKNGGTNTKNTTEITTEKTTEITEETTSQKNNLSVGTISHPISSYPVGSDGIRTDSMETKIRETREEIRERTGYYYLLKDNRLNTDVMTELIEIMVEVYVTGADVKISGTVIPYEMICERFDRYDQFVMEYVLMSLSDNYRKVGNIKKYLLATLYNAPATMANYIASDVRSGGMG